MKRAIVTGAAGFLGRHVARHLHLAGWSVVGIGHGNLDADGVRRWGFDFWSRADVNVESLTAVIQAEGRPNLVVHAAGGSSVGASREKPLEDFHCTVTTTAAVIEVLRRHAREAVLVYPSSAAVYGNSWRAPIPEWASLCPVSPYGAHKQLAEQLCVAASRNYELPCRIIRFFSLYGPELKKQLLWDIVCQTLDKPKAIILGGNGNESRDFLHVEDAARLVAAVAETVRDEVLIVNGGSGRAVTVRETAEALLQACGLNIPITFSGAPRAGDPQHLVADTPFASRLGFAPQWELADGLRSYAEWALQVLYSERKPVPRSLCGMGG